MRHWSLSIAALLVLLSLGSAIPALSAPAVVKNIKTDFGGVCDGTTIDSAAFHAFQTWALEWQKSNSGLIELDIPPGSFCIPGRSFAKGIKNLLVKGYGATMKQSQLAGSAQRQDSSHSARLLTVNAGSSSVTLKALTKTSLFTPGKWVLITGYDLQGLWHAPYGYPSNPHFFEYVQIANVNQTTGNISFSSPLKNSYLSTWPCYNSGNRFEVDAGGPATLYAIDSSWNAEVEYAGLTISNTGQTYAACRRFTLRDVRFTGANGGIPSQNGVWKCINVHMDSARIEADKLVDSVIIIGSTIKGIDFQSSSINVLKIDSSTITSSLIGTPKKAFLSNSTINTFWPGTMAYGRTDEVSIVNCTIHNFKGLGIRDKGVGDAGINTYATMTNGIISVPNTYDAQRWAVPGNKVFFAVSVGTICPFTILDVTQDDSTTFVHTSQSGTWPPATVATSGKISLQVHPAPIFTCRSSTGCPEILAVSEAPAGAPLKSFWKRTLKGDFGATSISVWGKLKSWKINVIKPYTGTLPLARLKLGAGSVNADFTQCWLNFSVNLKIAGERIITPVLITGAQTADSLDVSGFPGWKSWNLWIHHASVTYPDLSGQDSTTWPEVSVEVITDQNWFDTPSTIALKPAVSLRARAQFTYRTVSPHMGMQAIPSNATEISAYNLMGQQLLRKQLTSTSSRMEALKQIQNLSTCIIVKIHTGPLW